MSTITLPQPYDYLDYRLFLREWFHAKCTANPRYSHRLFAKRAGVKSPSLLHLVMKGERNLTENTLPGFCKALGLSGEAKLFFINLVRLQRSKNAKERNAIYQQLRASQHFRTAFALEDAGFEYLSTWYLPAIREMARSNSFRHDPEWVARHLKPRITLPQAAEALATLTRMGLLVPDANGSAKQADGTVVTPHEVTSLAVHNYHQNLIKLGAESLERFSGSERQVGAITVCITPERIESLREEIQQFQERILSMCDQDLEGDQVIQLNIQLFPLSRPLTEE